MTAIIDLMKIIGSNMMSVGDDLSFSGANRPSFLPLKIETPSVAPHRHRSAEAPFTSLQHSNSVFAFLRPLSSLEKIPKSNKYRLHDTFDDLLYLSSSSFKIWSLEE